MAATSCSTNTPTRLPTRSSRRSPDRGTTGAVAVNDWQGAMNEIANSKNPLTWDVFAAKRQEATRDLLAFGRENVPSQRILAVRDFIHCTLPVVNCDCSSSALSGERLDDCLGNRVGVLVEHKVAAVEIAQVGRRHKLLHEFRCRRQNKRVISPPDDERPRLPVLQIGVPFRIVLDVRRKVHKQPRHEARFSGIENAYASI